MNAVLGYQIDGDIERTLLAFDFGGPTEITARTVGTPPRVIVDLPETEFRLPRGAGTEAIGLIKAFRFGLMAAGRSRVVVDTTGPAKVARAEVLLDDARGAFRLEIELVPVSAGELAAIEIVEAAATIRPATPEQPAREPGALPQRPVIVIDPGHGGIDPGAAGLRISEKDLVLSVARLVAQRLEALGRYEIVMTRSTDVFVALDERVAISRRANSDLFISIHADSLATRELARSVRGATVYTLSEQASDDVARRRAASENAADLIAGLAVPQGSDDDVRGILVDLMRRESMGFATDFRKLLVSELRPRVHLAREAFRSGPFKVLRQPGAPAVLVELGFISNEDDERLMLSPAWQTDVAAAVSRAVDQHFRVRAASRR